MKGNLEKIIQKSEEVNLELKKRAVGYITAGFGLVAGLAWNDAIKTFIEKYFPAGNNTILAKFAYAVLITFILVIVSFYLTRIFKVEQKKETSKKSKK